MTTTSDGAEDEMFGIIRAYATGADGAQTRIGGPLAVRWPGKEEEVPDETKHWIRVSTQTVLSRMVGLVADGVGGRNRRKYEVSGLLFIQIFAPKKPGAYNAAKLLGDDLVSLLQKHRSGEVKFLNVRPQELDPEPKYYRRNVVSETEYETLN